MRVSIMGTNHLVSHGLALVLGALLSMSTYAGTILVDDFSTGTLPGFTDKYGTFNANAVSGTGSHAGTASGVLGGMRELTYNFGSVMRGGDVLGMESSAEGNILYFSSSSSRSNSFTLTYDGVSGSGMGLNANLSQASSLGLTAYADHWDTASMTLSLTDGNGVSRSLRLTPGPSTPSATEVDLAFNLNNSAFQGLNMSDIDRISLSYAGERGQDAYFMNTHIVTTVPDTADIPEPGTMALLLPMLGLLSLASRYTRRCQVSPKAGQSS